MMVRALPAMTVLFVGAVLACAPAAARQHTTPAAAGTPAAQVVTTPAAPPLAADAPAPAATAPAGAAPAAAAANPALAPAPAARPALRPELPAQPMVATSAGSLMQTIFGLLVVLAMLALFAWAMKRFGPRPQAGAAGLRIVGALNLGGRERLMVIEIGDQWIVVGASPGRVNALATRPRQDGSATGSTLEPHPHVAPASSFADWLKQTIENRHAK